MLEENGTVLEADTDWLWVETAPRSACSRCGAGSCSTSVIARLFGTRRNRFRLRNSLQAAPGDRVVIGIPDRVLVAASVQAYLVPLLVMVASVALAEHLEASEPFQALVALAGLAGGLALTGRMVRYGPTRERHTPRLLRKHPGPLSTTARSA